MTAYYGLFVKARHYRLSSSFPDDELLILPLHGADAEQADSDADSKEVFDNRVDECVYIVTRDELKHLGTAIIKMLQGEEDE